MKAWVVRDAKSYNDYVTVVFANTSGQAKSLALNTDACEDSEYINISARRMPELDKYYRGLDEIDWNNSDDRITLVKILGWYCSYEIDYPDCENCEAKEWCNGYSEQESVNVSNTKV